MPIIIGILILSSLFSPLIPNFVPEKSIVPVSQVKAEEIPPLEMKAKGVYVENSKTAEAIIEYKEDETWPIASLTKVMTALVYLEENPNLNKVVTLTEADQVEGAALLSRTGTKFRAYDLLNASLMASANNATNVLAREGTDLTLEQFIEKMNGRAKELGLKQTRFVEPTGINPDNRSTPKEYAVIINKALANPIIHQIMTSTYYEIKPLGKASFPIGTSNKLLKEPQNFEVEGGKTGFTYGSDYNFAAKMKKGDTEVTVVVFGDESLSTAIENSKKLATEALEKSGE